MKENKISYENLNEAIENEPLEVDCREKVEVKFRSCFGFLWLLLTGYWFQYIYNTYLKKKTN